MSLVYACESIPCLFVCKRVVLFLFMNPVLQPQVCVCLNSHFSRALSQVKVCAHGHPLRWLHHALLSTDVSSLYLCGPHPK